jgi:hypothetical protein
LYPGDCKKMRGWTKMRAHGFFASHGRRRKKKNFRRLFKKSSKFLLRRFIAFSLSAKTFLFAAESFGRKFDVYRSHACNWGGPLSNGQSHEWPQKLFTNSHDQLETSSSSSSSSGIWKCKRWLSSRLEPK